MRRIPVIIGIAVLLCAQANVESQSQKGDHPTLPISLPSYRESEDGLRRFVGDVFAAVESGDSGRISSYFSSLTIPDHNAWFLKAFGYIAAPRLEFKYEKYEHQLSFVPKAAFVSAAKAGTTDLEVNPLSVPTDPKTKFREVFVHEMKEPVELFSVWSITREKKRSAYLGDFVYIDGGFRYLPRGVVLALSTAPPRRITVAQDVQSAKILQKICPTYPDAGTVAHPKGIVIFHVVVGTDGDIEEAKPISGDAELAKAALDAVWLWHYYQTVVDGTPVEVDTTVKVDFGSLNDCVEGRPARL